MDQPFPVMLVVRRSNSTVLWMDIRRYLKDNCRLFRGPPLQVVFEGEPFNVLSVLKWRKAALFGAA